MSGASEWASIEDSEDKYQLYLCSREWAEKRIRVLERCNGLCERCQTAEAEAIHHLTYARKYDEPLEDLQGLCNACHSFNHGHSDFDPAAVTSIQDSMFDVCDRWHVSETQNQELSFGFERLDAICRMWPGNLIMLASRPAMGKTSFACNVILNALQSKGVLYISLEETNVEVTRRLLAIESRVNLRRIYRGAEALDEVEQDQLMVASQAISELNQLVITQQPCLTDANITDLIATHRKSTSLGVVVVDFLNLVRVENQQIINREQQLFETTRSLKIAARKWGLPILALAQVGREVEHREDKRPRLTDLRGSAMIEAIADTVLFVHRPAAYDPEDSPGEADIIVAKNRNGPTGTCRLGFTPESCKFIELAPIPDEILNSF